MLLVVDRDLAKYFRRHIGDPMSRKKSSKKHSRLSQELEKTTINNLAIQEGPTKKKWSIHDLKAIRPLTDAQQELFESWKTHDHICAHGSAGTGKAQPTSSYVLTPSGWKRLSRIRIDDEICTPSGEIAIVTGKYDQGRRRSFTLTLEDGASAECCEEHLWNVVYRKDGELIDETVDLHTIRYFMHNDIDVYIRNNQPTIFKKRKPNKEWARIGKRMAKGKPFSAGNFSVTKGNLSDRLSFFRAFLDVADAPAKFYNRGQILKMTVADKESADFVRNVCLSLGAKCTITRGFGQYYASVTYRKPKELYDPITSPHYNRQCTLDVVDEDQFLRKIESVEVGRPKNMVCIKVDHPDHSYITDGFIQTHNTFLALYLAFNERLGAEKHQKIVIVRSVVPTREVGHLPGTLEEKVEVYEQPYKNICHELFGRKSTYDDMKKAGLVEFATTSFIRGLTWDNTLVIVDEVQNLSEHEIDSVLTRIGENSRVILAGDSIQCDIQKGAPSGAKLLLRAIEHMDDITAVEFGTDDIVRSKFVKQWIVAAEKARKSR